MAKIATDLEQSKKLAKILPIESADMCWTYDFDTKCFTIKMYPYSRLVIPKYADSKITNPIPAWSLSALLDILPKTINFGYENDSIFVLRRLENGKYLADYYEISYVKDNPVDACVEMILKLKEEGRL